MKKSPECPVCYMDLTNVRNDVVCPYCHTVYTGPIPGVTVPQAGDDFTES